MNLQLPPFHPFLSDCLPASSGFQQARTVSQALCEMLRIQRLMTQSSTLGNFHRCVGGGRSVLMNQCRGWVECQARGKHSVSVGHTGRAPKAGSQDNHQGKFPGRDNAQEESVRRKCESCSVPEAGDFRQKGQQLGC